MRKSRAHYWFIGPAVALMILLLIMPVFVAATLSMTDYSLGNSSFNWVGIENYEKLFSRRSYQKMFSASLTYVLLVVPISVALGLGSALLISSLRFGGEMYKAVFFLPVMATLLAMAIVWEFALNPIVGVVNDVLRSGCDKSLVYGLLSGSWLGYEPRRLGTVLPALRNFHSGWATNNMLWARSPLLASGKALASIWCFIWPV